MPSPSTTTALLSSLLTTFILLHSQTTHALHIGAASPCYSECNGGSLTVTQDLSCLDPAYDASSGTAAGKRMRECLTCTERSSYANASDTATDQYWFMCEFTYSSSLSPLYLRPYTIPPPSGAR